MTRSPSKIADAIAQTEKALLAAEADRLANANEAREQVASFTEALSEARDDLQILGEDFACRPEAFDADALRIAEEKIKRFEFALSGAEARLRREERAKAVTNKDLAEIVAPIVRSALPGVQVYTCMTMPPEVTKSDFPIAFVVAKQNPGSARRASGLNAVGRIGGEVEVHYHRAIIHRDLNRRAVVEADPHGVQLHVMSEQTRPVGHNFIDLLRIRVEDGVPEIPTLNAEPSELALRLVGQGLRKALLTGPASDMVMPDAVTSTIETKHTGDLRLTVVEVAVSALPTSAPRAQHIRSLAKADSGGSLPRPDIFADHVETQRREHRLGAPNLRDASPDEVVASMVGQYFAGVGRVVSAELSSAKLVGEATKYVARFELASKSN